MRRDSPCTKFVECSAKGTFSNLGWKRRGMKNVHFSTENWRCLVSAERVVFGRAVLLPSGGGICPRIFKKVLCKNNKFCTQFFIWLQKCIQSIEKGVAALVARSPLNLPLPHTLWRKRTTGPIRLVLKLDVNDGSPEKKGKGVENKGILLQGLNGTHAQMHTPSWSSLNSHTHAERRTRQVRFKTDRSVVQSAYCE